MRYVHIYWRNFMYEKYWMRSFKIICFIYKYIFSPAQRPKMGCFDFYIIFESIFWIIEIISAKSSQYEIWHMGWITQKRDLRFISWKPILIFNQMCNEHVKKNKGIKELYINKITSHLITSHHITTQSVFFVSSESDPNDSAVHES